MVRFLLISSLGFPTVAGSLDHGSGVVLLPTAQEQAGAHHHQQAGESKVPPCFHSRPVVQKHGRSREQHQEPKPTTHGFPPRCYANQDSFESRMGPLTHCGLVPNRPGSKTSQGPDDRALHHRQHQVSHPELAQKARLRVEIPLGSISARRMPRRDQESGREGLKARRSASYGALVEVIGTEPMIHAQETRSVRTTRAGRTAPVNITRIRATPESLRRASSALGALKNPWDVL